jgi:arginine decarboxylase
MVAWTNPLYYALSRSQPARLFRARPGPSLDKGVETVDAYIPKRMFFTKGVGYHRNKLQSFELALRDAGVEQCNIVTISSIFPPDCKLITREAGVKELKPGQITFTVLAQNSTNEPNRLISAAVGLARPKNAKQYGYISEHHAFGETMRKSADFAEDLAATMLASTMGIELDPDVAWDERKQLYKVGKRLFVSKSVAQSARGDKRGLWTTVIACAVMLLD